MVTDKRKNYLFERIRKYHQLIVERSELENESEFEISYLYEVDDEYAGICVQVMDLRDEIDETLLDSKYAPIVGLTNNQFYELNFFIESSDRAFIQNIKKHLDFRLLTLKEEMKQRLKAVKTLRLCSDLDSHVRYLYSEVIDCYIKGAFEASCVLCRAISEFLLEEYLKKMSCGKKIQNSKDEPSLLEIAIKNKLLSPYMRDIYKKIRKKANKILHQKDTQAEELQALDSIELLQVFIRKFPK